MHRLKVTFKKFNVSSYRALLPPIGVTGEILFQVLMICSQCFTELRCVFLLFNGSTIIKGISAFLLYIQIHVVLYMKLSPHDVLFRPFRSRQWSC